MIYIYICICQFVFVLVIVTRTRKSPRIGSLSKSWISCSSLASLESLAHTSSDLGDSLTLYGLDILNMANFGFKYYLGIKSLQNWKGPNFSSLTPPPPITLAIVKTYLEKLSKGLEREFRPAVMIYLSNSWSQSPSTPRQSLLSWLAAEETRGTWKHKSQ